MKILHSCPYEYRKGIVMKTLFFICLFVRGFLFVLLFGSFQSEGFQLK